MSRLLIKRKIEGFDVSVWKLVFGRRKTGKTFFVKNFVKWNEYYFVHRNRSIIEIKNRKNIEYNELLSRIELGKNLRIVIDEFHRLPEDFLDFLHSLAGEGADLILITSSLHFAKEILGKKSPLLGLVHPIRFSIFSPSEILNNLKNYLNGRELIEKSVFLREPFFVDLFDSENFYKRLFERLKIFVPALLGEIFTEEDRKLTEVYEGILLSVATGKRTSTEIANILFSKELISKNDPGIISQHLRTLTQMDILRGIDVFGKKKKYHYIISSPIIDLYYYVEGKYGIDFIKNFRSILKEKLPKYIEIFFSDFLSEVFGMKPVIVSKPDLEIDIALMEFQKLKIVGEVKWVKSLDRNELIEIEEKLNKFKDCKKILIIPEKNILPYEPKGIEVWDVEKIIEEIRKM